MSRRPGTNYTLTRRVLASMVSTDTLESLAPILTPLVVAVVGGWYNYRLYRIERRHKQRIEFTVDATFHRREDGPYLAEFLMDVHNRGNVRQEFTAVRLRVRGLKGGDPAAFWDESGRSRAAEDGSRRSETPPEERKRLEFPHEILDVDVLPNRVFIEPGVNQRITYVTVVEETYEYVLANAEFSYESPRLVPHTAERMFATDPTDGA